MSSDRSFVENVKLNLDIVKLIEKTVSLHHENGEWYAGATSHSSQSGASLKVNSREQYYINWATGDRGDVFNWIAYASGLDIKNDFPEILKIAASEAGVPVEDVTEEEKKRAAETHSVHEVLTHAAEIYHGNLTPQIRDFIHANWGINDETIDALKIGYANPDGRTLTKRIGVNDLKNTGLLIKVGDFYREFFWGRVVFPYWNHGQVVNFAARGDEKDRDGNTLKPTDHLILQTPNTKYESAKYKKLLTHSEKHQYVHESVSNRYLWGEDTLRGYDHCVITEGIADSIVLRQHGFPVLSPITVQFSNRDTEKLVNIAKRLKTVYVANDNEASGAGEKGAIKTGLLLRSAGVDVRIVTLPTNGTSKMDVAEYFLTHTTGEFETLLKQSNPILRHMLLKITMSSDDETRLNQAKKFIKDYLLDLKEDDAEAFILTNIKKYFALTNEAYTLIKRFYKIERKEKKGTGLGNDIPIDGDYEYITFGNKDDDAARAIAILTRGFIEQYHPVFCLGGALYVYNEGVYTNDDQTRDRAKRFIYKLAEKHHIHISPKNVENVLKRVCDETAISSNDLNSNPERLVVKNGILDVKSQKLYPHNPKERHVVKVDVVYDPAKTINGPFKNYLESTFKGVEWEIPIVQEMIGYCLYKGYFLEKFFFLIGDGGNGRSTLINTITRLLGEKNVSAMEFHEICQPSDKHALMGLHGKMANLCGETGVDDIKNMGKMKKATGRDLIRARELYKPWVEFYSYAKIILSGNNPPKIHDGTRGRKRRLVTIIFPNKFLEGKTADNGLEEKLFTPDSLTGILNWALEGLNRLLTNRKLSDERTEAQITVGYEKMSFPMKYFVMDHIDDVCGGMDETTDRAAFAASRLTEATVFQTYAKYAELNGLPSLRQKDIVEGIINECTAVGINVRRCRDKYRVDCEGKPIQRENYFKGIKLCGFDDCNESTEKTETTPEPEPQQNEHETEFEEIRLRDNLSQLEKEKCALIQFKKRSKTNLWMSSDDIDKFIDEFMRVNSVKPGRDRLVIIARTLNSTGWKYPVGVFV